MEDPTKKTESVESPEIREWKERGRKLESQRNDALSNGNREMYDQVNNQIFEHMTSKPVGSGKEVVSSGETNIGGENSLQVESVSSIGPEKGEYLSSVETQAYSDALNEIVPEVNADKEQALENLKHLNDGDDLGLFYLGEVGLSARDLNELEKSVVKQAYEKIKTRLLDQKTDFGRLKNLDFSNFKITFDNPMLPRPKKTEFVTVMLAQQKDFLQGKPNRESLIGAGSFGTNVAYAEKLGLINHDQAVEYLTQ